MCLQINIYDCLILQCCRYRSFTDLVKLIEVYIGVNNNYMLLTRGEAVCMSVCSSAVWSCVKVALLVSVLLQMRLSTLPYYIHYQIHKGKDMSFFIFLLIPCFFVFSSNLLTVSATNKILKIYHQKSSCNVDIVPSGLSGISINFHTLYFNNKTTNWLTQLCLFQVFGNMCERRQTLSNLRGEFHSFFAYCESLLRCIPAGWLC